MTYTFIDLFSGIGGIRLGFEKSGCECVYAIEIDKNTGITYNENFGHHPFSSDISWKSMNTLPDFDILCGGFPCQPFSLAGNLKGFDDIRGTLFFEIVRFLKGKHPKAFFLENVSNLLSHDKGNTFRIVKESIEKLGYSFYYKTINSKLLVPQNRERLYMIGFKDRTLDFKFPEIPDLKPKLKDILEDNVENKYFYTEKNIIYEELKNNMNNNETVYQWRRTYVRENKENLCPTLTANMGSGGHNVPIINVDNKYTLTDGTWNSLQNHRKNHEAKGNGFGYSIADTNNCSNTLSARYYKDGSEILIPQNKKNPRKLTPRECARLQGFPDTFKIPVSDAHAYHQFGNSVTVPIIEYLAKEIVKTLNEQPKRKEPYRTQPSVFDF